MSIGRSLLNTRLGARRVIAQRTCTASSTALKYLLPDHLGSTVGTIDAATGNTFTVKYWPFGGVRSGVLTSDRGFTGQYKEGPLTTTMDAYFYNARFYSPKTAHFMSADPMTADGPNRFSYVLNNPVNYRDPSGRCIPGRSHCSADEMKNIVGCGLDGGCSSPNGAVSEGDWRRYSTWILGQSTFWGFFFRADAHAVGGADWPFRVVGAVLNRPATVDRLNIIAPEGWNVLALLISRGVGSSAAYSSRGPAMSGAFFKASLFDLYWGTRTIWDVSPLERVGGFEWWRWGTSELGTNYSLQRYMEWNLKLPTHNAGSLGSSFQWATIDAFHKLSGSYSTGVVDGLGWSMTQRDLLSSRGLPVSPAPPSPPYGPDDTLPPVNPVPEYEES